jgi:hypothetical protein
MSDQNWQEDWQRRNQPQPQQQPPMQEQRGFQTQNQQQPDSFNERQRQQEDERRRQRDEQWDKGRERNAMAQGTAGEAQTIDLGQIDEMVRGEYEGIEQPGLHPANVPSRRFGFEGAEQRDPHKSVRDLEDITGNPGHVGVTPYAPANSINQVNTPGEPGPRSINEPPNVDQPNPEASFERSRAQRQQY